MRVPVEWLKEFVPSRLAPKVLAERLTMAGLEVIGIHDSPQGPVLDLEVTPNRPDWLSIVGVAREVAALTGQRLKTPAPATRRPAARAPTQALVIRIEDPQGCTQYVGRLLDGITIKPSPDWMQQRLLACGIRPINNVVDITNYVLLELGQPLHAFDADRLADSTILVRRARAGERLTLLDGTAKVLSADILVIADARVPVAVAGVMGGTGSAVTAGTRRVVLESAAFDPVTVRRTARALGATTESSYRFERGIDPAGVEAASVRAAALLAQGAGGQVQAVASVGRRAERPVVISLSLDRMNRWLGTRLGAPDARTALARLGCRVAGDGSRLAVVVPSFRRDLRQEADLYEDVARVIGYERIPSRLPATPPGVPEGGARDYHRLQSLRCLCASLGLTEAITWALLSEQDLDRCGYSLADAVRLANPISQDHAILRPSLCMGLLQSVRQNLTRGVDGVALFELGGVTDTRRLPEQPQRLGIVLSGRWLQDWQGRQASDFYRLKGLLSALTERLCGAPVSAAAADQPWTESGQGAVLRLREDPVGVAGLVARRTAHALDLEHDVWYAELAVDRLLAQRRREVEAHAPSTLPPVKRDLSVVVANSVAYATVVGVLREAGGSLAADVKLIDRYTGKQVPAGHYSLTFSLDYRDPARTLTAEEVDTLHRRIGQALVERCQATLR